MENSEIEDLEVSLLLEALHERYGYDFRDYARATMVRRIRQFAVKAGVERVSELLPRVLYDPGFFQSLIVDFSIPVTEMFRDPGFYHTLRKEVIPLLKTYPFIRIWHAGCATGEEVYSLAILLKDEGLYERATIFATDFNDTALDRAREGIFPLEHVRSYTKNYQDSGGVHSLSRYYHADQEHIVLDRGLGKNITFANHNLVSDQVFGEMHMVLCRNVLIYFNKKLQGRVLELFDGSLVRGGFLCLGSRETIRFSTLSNFYGRVDERQKIYRKQMGTEGGKRDLPDGTS
ncbi:MAG: protein-glutamate O-methyltransferase CheR [Thermodesulfobacteriota bacterium]